MFIFRQSQDIKLQALSNLGFVIILTQQQLYNTLQEEKGIVARPGLSPYHCLAIVVKNKNPTSY